MKSLWRKRIFPTDGNLKAISAHECYPITTCMLLLLDLKTADEFQLILYKHDCTCFVLDFFSILNKKLLWLQKVAFVACNLLVSGGIRWDR